MTASRSALTLLLSITSLISALNVFEARTANAQAAVIPCTPSVTPQDLLNSICTTEAATYGVTFYQIGLCTSDPLIAQTPDTTSCYFIYNNNSGQYIDIGSQSPNRTFTLDTLPSNQRPSGAYPYIYAVWGNSVLMKGEATVSTGRFFTSNTAYINPDPSQTSGGTLGTSNSSQYAAFPSPTVRINGNSCFGINQVGGGYSILTSTNQATTYNVASSACTGAAKLAVSARTADLFGSTFVVTSNVNGINLRFSTPEAIGLIANLKIPGNPGGGFDYVFDFRGFSLSLVFSQ